MQGIVVQSYAVAYSRRAATRSLDEWLRAEGCPLSPASYNGAMIDSLSILRVIQRVKPKEI